MPIHVKSEIGTLKRVMLHRPGQELEHLVPGELERLLFDDIPYLRAARQEHDVFAGILRGQGVEVVYLEDLMAGTLKGRPQLREHFIRQFIEEGGNIAQKFKDQLFRLLDGIEDERELVQKTMAGVRMNELKAGGHSPLADRVRPDSRFILDPIPNLYFTRDPFASIGCGVSLNYMYSRTRRRETIYGSYILEEHPDFAGSTPFYYRRDYPFSIEGGDILNLSRRVLGVGISQRTQPEAIEQLASAIFADESSEIDTVLAFEIPSTRAFMHLDTVFTQVDVDKFTVHPGILGTLRIFELTGRGQGKLTTREVSGPLEQVLAGYLGLDRVQLIRCGGSSQIAAEREQWNDGSNTLCIAPGVVVVYDRNYVTNQILEDSGIRVLKMPSAELSRGRGGPRCMSMPLWRDEI